MTRPSRITPGKPMETRSKDGSGATRLASARKRVAGGHGWGVGTRTRFTTIRPATSRTEALSPVPPISIARVRGPCREAAARSPFAPVIARLPPRPSAGHHDLGHHADEETAFDDANDG